MGTDAWVDQHHHIHSVGGPHPDRSLHPGVLWHRLRRRQPLSGIAWTDHASHLGQRSKILRLQASCDRKLRRESCAPATGADQNVQRAIMPSRKSRMMCGAVWRDPKSSSPALRAQDNHDYRACATYALNTAIAKHLTRKTPSCATFRIGILGRLKSFPLANVFRGQSGTSEVRCCSPIETFPPASSFHEVCK